jgi:hypothetical protein
MQRLVCYDSRGAAAIALTFQPDQTIDLNPASQLFIVSAKLFRMNLRGLLLPAWDLLPQNYPH